MKIKLHFLLLIYAVAACISSCEKAVEFELNDVEPKLVVEATIENGEPPLVILTRSQAYFSAINPAILANSFVRNAEVYVSNGALTHKLKEYAVPAGGYTFYFYSADPASPATLFEGELRKSYSLRIVTNGKEYTATTNIPDTTRRIDSLFWKPAPAGNNPNFVALMVKATDRPGLGDYIRYYTQRNSEEFYPGINSVYDDQVIDGTTYTVQVERGKLRDGNDTSELGSFFLKGDTITMKLSNIDKATYDFWRTMEFTYVSVGNPFSSPTKVLSNISNGGLGYFGGYASQYRTLVVPR
jgi:hypothetical protein